MISIPNVTPAQFIQLQESCAPQATITPNSENSGAITGHGVTATYAYAPASQILTVEVVHKPFFISEAAIQKSLEDALG